MFVPKNNRSEIKCPKHRADGQKILTVLKYQPGSRSQPHTTKAAALAPVGILVALKYCLSNKTLKTACSHAKRRKSE